MVLQEPFNKSFHKKLHPPTDKLTNKNLTAKTRSIAQNTQNCLCFICLFRFVCFVSFKIEIPHDGIPHSCNMTASNQIKTEMCQSPIARAQAALSTYFSHAYHYCQKPYRLYLPNLSHSNRSQVFQPCNDL